MKVVFSKTDSSLKTAMEKLAMRVGLSPSRYAEAVIKQHVAYWLKRMRNL